MMNFNQQGVAYRMQHIKLKKRYLWIDPNSWLIHQLIVFYFLLLNVWKRISFEKNWNTFSRCTYYMLYIIYLSIDKTTPVLAPSEASLLLKKYPESFWKSLLSIEGHSVCHILSSERLNEELRIFRAWIFISFLGNLYLMPFGAF